MAQLQMLYSEWLDQDIVVRIQMKSPLVLEGTLANCSVFNVPSIILRPDKYNITPCPQDACRAGT